MKKLLVLPLALALMAPGPPKVTICHVVVDPPVTMDVPLPALSAHLGHGDYLGACVAPTPTAPPPTPTPTEPAPTPTPGPTEPPPTEIASTPSSARPLFKMWLLTRGNEHCLLISDTHPSVGRQAQACFPRIYLSWQATSAPCAAYVYDDDTWACDKYTPWRLPLDQLRGVWKNHQAKESR